MIKFGTRLSRAISAAKGFSLVEMCVAIAVVAVTFMGIIALLGVGFTNVQTSSQQLVATNIAAAIISDLRSTPSYATTPVKSVRYSLALPTSTASSSTAPLSGITPYYLYFDNMQNVLGSPSTGPASSVPSGAAYAACVYLTRISAIGSAPTTVESGDSDMARVVVYWPAQTTAVPAGNVEVVAQFGVR